MYTAKFTKNEWPLAFSHANYIYNMTPHPHLNNTKCPFEFAAGIKPDVSKLRLFGCIAYAFIDPSRRAGKFAHRVKPYIYVGNDDESNGYLLYDRTKYETTTQGIVQFVEMWTYMAQCSALMTKHLSTTMCTKQTFLQTT